MAVKKATALNFFEENRIVIIAIALFIGFVGFMMFVSNQNKIDFSKYDLAKIIPSDKNTGEIAEHIYEGEKSNQKAVLVEYGDLQCPSCATMSSKIDALAKEYKGKLTVIFRNFPLDGHPNALSAAAAAESAGLQGKYFEMQKLLFEKQNEWGPSSIQERGNFYEKYAKDLGLDVEKFKNDMKSETVAKKIRFDKLAGKEANATGTPTFILNGKNIGSDIWGDDAKFREEIEKLIK